MPKAEKGWFTKAVMAEIFGTTEQNFDASIRRWVPDQYIRKVGKTLQFKASAVIEAVIDRRVEKESGGDLLKQKLLNEQFLTARLKRQALETSMVPLAGIEEMGVRAFSRIQAAGESLQKRFGVEARDELLEYIAAAQKDMLDYLSVVKPVDPDSISTDDESGEPLDRGRDPKATKNHAAVRRGRNRNPERSV